MITGRKTMTPGEVECSQSAAAGAPAWLAALALGAATGVVWMLVV
jgi:hypothetical protein